MLRKSPKNHGQTLREKRSAYLLVRFSHNDQVLVNFELNGRLELVREAQVPETISRHPHLGSLELLLLFRQLLLGRIERQVVYVNITGEKAYIILVRSR
jgi:hypothetical protein